MHIKVEISNVTQTENIAGVQEPIIGQKIDEADIRMKDGEVSLLGGLTSNSNSLSIAGIPGVANIPLLGYLFGTRSRDRETDDIIVALVPHIIRAPEFSDDASNGVYAGTEQVQRVERHADGAAPAYSGSASGGPVGNPIQGVPGTPAAGTYEQEPPQEPSPEPVNPQYPPLQPGLGGGQAVQPPVLRPRSAPLPPSSQPPASP